MTIIFGLTGGIACGKSTVAAMMREHGAAVIDADLIAREVVEPGSPALAAIVARWGDGMLTSDGHLDRAALATLVFDDAHARRALERIVHPRVTEVSMARIEDLTNKACRVIVYEAALLVENRAHEAPWMHGLVVVSLPRALQRTRLMLRDQLDAAAADARIDAQLPLRDKLAAADHVIDNAGSLDDTRAQVAALWRAIESL